MKIKKLASCVLFENKQIPRKRIIQIKNDLRKVFKCKKLTKKLLNKVISEKVKFHNHTHGQIVVSKIENIQDFIKQWRLHFINNNECKFLPKNWSENYE